MFLAQIEAAGEAIDLSAAAVLWFAETTFVPRQMRQMSLRITNINQHRQCFVKVCTLANSIDEAVQGRLLMLWSAIRKVCPECSQWRLTQCPSRSSSPATTPTKP